MNSFFDTFTTLAKDLMVSHSFSQYPEILRADNVILTTQSSSRTSCHIQYMKFWRSHSYGFISHNQNTVIHP